MTSCVSGRDQFHCPDLWELWQAALALLPRGRAWQTHEEMATAAVMGDPAQYGTYQAGGTQGIGGEIDIEAATVLQQFWLAFAAVSHYLHERACELLSEFFCATVNANEPQWRIDYDFPGNCPAWPDLCAKVAAQGGARCDDTWAPMALAMGWSIVCLDCNASQAACLEAGCGQACGCPPDTIFIAVDSSQSPAYASEGAALTSLRCVIEQVRHAHLKVYYLIDGTPV